MIKDLHARKPAEQIYPIWQNPHVMNKEHPICRKIPCWWTIHYILPGAIIWTILSEKYIFLDTVYSHASVHSSLTTMAGKNATFRNRQKYPSKWYISPQNCKDFLPKAKFPGNEIPKFHILSMHVDHQWPTCHMYIHTCWLYHINWMYPNVIWDDELCHSTLMITLLDMMIGDTL